MRKFLLAFGAILLSTSAFAQTAPLVTKGGPVVVYPYNGGSGLYAGVNTMAGVANTSVNGTLLGSAVGGNLTAAGGAIGGTVGYTSGNSAFWYAIEASADYQNITATAPSAASSVASRWSSEQVVKIGGSTPVNFLSSIANLGVNFPTFNLPVAPSGISVAASPHPYIMGGVKEFGLTGGIGVAGGSTWGVAPLVGAGTIAQIVDSTGKPTGLALDLFAEIVFANKGLAINNVFGTAGPPLAGGNLTMGNQYFAGAKVLF